MISYIALLDNKTNKVRRYLQLKLIQQMIYIHFKL